MEMGEWVDGRWEWKLKWNKELFQREVEKVDDLLRLIACFTSVANKNDSWVWIKESSGLYSVCFAYEALQGS